MSTKIEQIYPINSYVTYLNYNYKIIQYCGRYKLLYLESLGFVHPSNVTRSKKERNPSISDLLNWISSGNIPTTEHPLTEWAFNSRS